MTAATARAKAKPKAWTSPKTRQRVELGLSLSRVAYRDVRHIQFPAERKPKKDAKRAAVSFMWSTRRGMAPIYVWSAETMAGQVLEALGHGWVPFWLHTPLMAGGAVWWWRKTRRKYGVRVDISQVEGWNERRRATREAKEVVRKWDKAVTELKFDGVRLRRLTYTEFSVAIDVSGTTNLGDAEMQLKRKAIERAFKGKRNSIRIEKTPWDDTSTAIRWRVMRKDPHAGNLPAPAVTLVDPTRPLVPVGLFETGEDVFVSLREHLLIAGRSGAGKSALIQVIMRALTQQDWISVLCLDMGFGATELGPWRDKVSFCGESKEDAETLFDAVMVELKRRGELMAQRGWKNWRCSPDEPLLAIVVDECQELIKMKEKTIRLAKLLRKYGGFLLMATQYPTSKSIPPDVKHQLPQAIGLQVKNGVASQAIFGDDYAASGWLAHELELYRFYIESSIHRDPCVAKGFYLSEAECDRAVREALEPMPFGVPTDGSPVASVTVADPPRGKKRKATPEDVLWAIHELGGETKGTEIDKLLDIHQTYRSEHIRKLKADGKVKEIEGHRYRVTAD